MIYLAIDPGLTTGLAWFDTRSEVFDSTEVQGRYDLYDHLEVTWFELNAPSAVIIERWDVRKNTHQLTNQDDVRYIIGWVDGQCHRCRVPYHEQRPAEAKKFATDDKLKALGWYKGGFGHADDAARHLLVFLAKIRHASILEKIV